MTALVVLLYGILVAVGGVMGYVKAGSVASLVSGGGAGLILLGASVAMMRGSYALGWWISLFVALLLLARFGMAAMNDFKLMPGGMVIAMSLIVLAVLFFHRTR
jgi:uncharacterized membrane protein (UPF0136 family)